MKLRMMAIAFGLPAKDCARQQRLSPQGDKALRIEVFRMEGPESHGSSGRRRYVRPP
jgi:hypothetical protein